MVDEQKDEVEGQTVKARGYQPGPDVKGPPIKYRFEPGKGVAGEPLRHSNESEGSDDAEATDAEEHDADEPEVEGQAVKST